MLKKVCELSDLKLLDEGSGSFTGYATKWGVWDRVKEATVKGAFAWDLDSFLKDGFIPVGHNWDQLGVATIADAYEDETGLVVKGDFHSTAAAQEARTWVKERLARGKSVGLSIGYEVLEAENTSKGRLLRKIKLYEVSLVSVPCLPAAQAVSAKSAEEEKASPKADPDAGPDWMSHDMCMAAMREANDHLMMNVADGLYGGHTAKQVEPHFDGHKARCMSVYKCLMGKSQDEREAVAKALKQFLAGEEPPAGASLAEEFDAALAAVANCIDRARAVKDLREKEGRTLSEERRSQLGELIARGQVLLDATTPAPKTLAPEAAAALLAYYRQKANRREPAAA